MLEGLEQAWRITGARIVGQANCYNQSGGNVKSIRE